MSIVAEVLFKSKATDTAHYLLLVIAAYNDLYGPEHTFPTVATLARHINKQPRYTQKLIRRLEKGGHLHVRRAPNEESGPSLYTVLRPWSTRVLEDIPVLQNTVLYDTSVLQDTPVSQDSPGLATPVLQDIQFFLEKEREERSELPVPQDRVSPETGERSPTDTPAAPPLQYKPTRTRPRNRGKRAELRLVSLHEYEGKLCPKGHTWQGKQVSLRRHPSGTCVECNREGMRKRRQG